MKKIRPHIYQFIKNKYIVRMIIALILFISGMGLVQIAKQNSSFAEWYYKTVYPCFAVPISFITGLFPFSIAEFVLIFFIAGAAYYIIFLIVKMIRKRDLQVLLRLISSILLTSSIIYFTFNAWCSVNYYREPLIDIMKIEKRVITTDMALETGLKLVSKINEFSKELKYDEFDFSNFNGSFSKLNSFVNQGYQKAASTYPVLSMPFGMSTNVKPVILSSLMTYTYIVGVFFPFTFEPNLNTNFPDFLLPHSAAHEMAHLRGFMREDEADFVAFLACDFSDDHYVRYSAYMSAFMRLTNRIDATSLDKLYQALSVKAANELNAYTKFLNIKKTPVADISDAVNDKYLQSQGQADGVKSYGRMIDLLILYLIPHIK